MASKEQKLWGGRFKKELDKVAQDYSYSLYIDQVLLPYDIFTNIAHVETLHRAGVITQAESEKIISGLRTVEKTLSSEDLSVYFETVEDIHTLIQLKLEEKIGAVAKKLHTARSRNDQVITSTKLYLKDAIAYLIDKITAYQKALLELSLKADMVAIPAYTHLQRAQVVLMAHHLLAYVEMAERDKLRLKSSLYELDEMPLGSGAVAGLAFDLDREYTAKLLGFSRLSENSMDAVSSRDGLISILSDISIIFMHLSRLSEDMILWNSQEFRFITLPDDFATGSSIMPHKKNPDMFELIRGRSGKIYGNLVSLLVTMKGLPLAYNRDMQEDKESIVSSLTLAFDTFDVLVGMLPHIEICKDKCMSAAADSLLYATDLMDYIVKKGVSLKDAHTIVGEMVLYSLNNNKDLGRLSFDEYRTFSQLIEKDITSIFNPDYSMRQRISQGSTNPKKVKSMIQKWQRRLAKA
jgi:argininosuccinate lyase